MKRVILLLVLLPVLAFAQSLKVDSPRNVIFVVGDGMGVAQVYSSIVAQGGDSSVFLQFPITGFSRTYSYDKYTTDSGAGGSALMTGHKVENHHIAKGPDGTDYPSFLSQARQQYGKSVGFVVTSSVLDATPASTYAHVTDRKLFDSISMQMAQSGFQVMIGGDRNSFLPKHRKDGLNPIDTLVSRGYQMAYSLDELSRLKGDHICALLSEGKPGKAPQRGEMLCAGVRKALETLSTNERGFVLMVEGSQIDWACHLNNGQYLAAELADFEEMLRIVLDFARHDGNTLVVVTADHETGGLSLHDGGIAEGDNDMHFARLDHTGVMVPVFAFGPGSGRFSGIQQNTDIPAKIRRLLFPTKIKPNPEDDKVLRQTRPTLAP